MVKIRDNVRGVQQGKVYGKWTVLGKPFYANERSLVVCRCVCGYVGIVHCGRLSGGKSNGCQPCIARKNATKHGNSVNGRASRLERIWSGMKYRCLSKKSQAYEYYGARGICVCDEWKDSCSAFIEWAKKNGYGDDLELDRIDNNGNYEPSNCRWVTSSANCRNKRKNRIVTAFGESKCLAEWVEDHRCLVNYSLLRARIGLGWPAEKAMTFPKRSRKPDAKK